MFQTRHNLRIHIERQPDRTSVLLSGRLDSHTAKEFKQSLQDALVSAAACIDVDLAGVTAVDGMGLASLVWAWRTAASGGRELRVSRMRPKVRELVERMNLHLLMRIVEGPMSA
jgi:anti-anti-sigma factor